MWNLKNIDEIYVLNKHAENEKWLNSEVLWNYLI